MESRSRTWLPPRNILHPLVNQALNTSMVGTLPTAPPAWSRYERQACGKTCGTWNWDFTDQNDVLAEANWEKNGENLGLTVSRRNSLAWFDGKAEVVGRCWKHHLELQLCDAVGIDEATLSNELWQIWLISTILCQRGRFQPSLVTSKLPPSSPFRPAALKPWLHRPPKS